MSASQQEALLRAVAEFGFGGVFLWEPDTYRKGSGWREPCDLAWICKRTALLLNMQEGNRTYARQLDHNLKQLRGWLRMWHAGHVLTGSNAWQSFEIAMDDIDEIVLLSVGDAPDTKLEVLQFEPRGPAEEKVVTMASVPAEILLDLVRKQGGPLDLAHLLTLTCSADIGPLPVEQAHELVTRVHVTHYRAALDKVLPDRDTDRDDEVWRTLFSPLRHLPEALRPTDEQHSLWQMIRPLRALNDMDWHGCLLVTMALVDLIDPVRDLALGETGIMAWAGRRDAGPYTWFLAVGRGDQAVAVQEQTLDLMARAEAEDPRREYLMVMVLISGQGDDVTEVVFVVAGDAEAGSAVGRAFRRGCSIDQFGRGS